MSFARERGNASPTLFISRAKTALSWRIEMWRGLTAPVEQLGSFVRAQQERTQADLAVTQGQPQRKGQSEDLAPLTLALYYAVWW